MPFFSCLSARSFRRTLTLAACLLSLTVVPSAARAQATAPALALGSATVGSTVTGTVTFTFSGSTTVASVAVLTQGATGKDFQAGTQLASACKAGTYAASSTCTVVVQFKPLIPGLRLGAAVLLDGNSNKLASGTVAGVGVGGLAQLPLAAAPTARASLPAYARVAAYDGAGNLFVLGQANPGTEIKTDGSTVSFYPNSPSGSTFYFGLAIDGAGYLYVPDSNGTTIARIDPVGLVQTTFISGLTSPTALAFDPSGTLFAVDYYGIEKISSAGVVSLAYAEQGNAIIGLAFDPAGNLFYATSSGGGRPSLLNSIYKVAAGQSTSTLVVQVNASNSYVLQSIAVDAASNILYSLYPSGDYQIPAGVTGSLGTLLLSTNVAPNVVTLSGTGTFATSLDGISFTQYNRLAQNLAAGSATTTAVGSKSTAQSVTVENDGNAALTPTAITGNGAANATGYTCATGTAVAPGGTCTLGVQFAPTAHGSPQTGTLTLAGNTLSPVVSITGYVTGDPVGLSFSTPPPSSLQTGQNAGTAAVAISDNSGSATTSTAAVTLTVTGPSSYSQTYTVNAVNGTATFNLSGATLTTTGTYTYTATSSGLTSAALNETVYPYKLIYTTGPSPSFTAGGNAGVVKVAIEDNSGNATTQTNPVTLTVTGPNSYSQTYGPTNPVNGTATFDLSGIALTRSGTYLYTASATGLTSASSSETVFAGAQVGVSVTPASLSTYTTAADNITVSAVDQYGNTVTGNTDTISLTSSDPAATLPTAFALVSGTATRAVTFNTVGNQTVTASDSSNTGIPAGTSASITVAPVPVFTVTVSTDPATGTAGNCTNQAAAGAAADSSCSLRDALAATNALNLTGTTNAQPVINFAPALSGGTITLAAALRPTANVNIAGPGAASLTIAPSTNNYTYNAFTSTTSSLGFTLSGVTVSGFGIPGSSSGAALYFSPTNASNADLLTLSNSTFSNNGGTPGGTTGSTAGGALYSAYGTVAVTGSTFTGNSAIQGGALYFASAQNVTIMGSTFGTQAAPNRALSGNGGAVNLATSPATISTSTFAYNTASASGAAVSTTGALTLNTDVFLNNAATTYGGAVYGTAALTIAGSTLDNNTAKLYGGAVYATNLLTVSGSSFTANQAGGTTTTFGGAIYDAYTTASGSISNTNFIANRAVTTSTTAYGGAVYVARVNLTNVLFSGNYTSSTNISYGGAAYYNSLGGTNTLTGVTFTGNSTQTGATGAPMQYGGALFTSGTVNLYNTTITGNSAKVGGGVQKSNGALNLYNSVVSGNTAPSYPDINTGASSASASYVGASTGTTCSASCTPLLSALGSYGGGTVGAPGYTTPVMTLLPLPGSPLLAAGNTATLNAATTDARGLPRTLTEAGATRVDIGATEANYSLAFLQQPPASTATATNFTPAPTVQLYESGLPFAPGVSTGTLNFAAASGTLSATTAPVSATGLTTLTASVATPQNSDSLTASVRSGATGTPTLATSTSNLFNIVDSAAASLTFSAPPRLQVVNGGNAGVVKVSLTDSTGAVATGATPVVTLTVSATGYTTATYTATASAGVATFDLSGVPLTTNGTYTYAATASSYTADTATATETVAAQQPGSFTITGLPATAQLGSSYSMTVTAKDTTGATLTGFTGTVQLASSDSAATFSVANYTFTTADAGVHAFTVTFNTRGTQTVSATTNAMQTGTASTKVVLDFIWLVNANGTVDKLNESGAAVTGAVGMAASTSSRGGLAIDASGNVWSVTNANNTLNFVSTAGVNAATYSGGGLNAPLAVAVDGLGSVWVANSGNSSVSAFLPTGVAQSPAGGYGSSATLGTPSAIAIDNTGGVWVTGSTGNSVTHVFGAAAPVTTPTAAAVAGSTVGARP